MTQTLEALIAGETARPLPPEIAGIAAAVRARYPLARAILVYGSILRGADPLRSPVDLYVLVEHGGDAGANAISRAGQALLPPNVYHFEAGPDGRRLSAKIAVLTLRAFARAMRPQHRDPYFWARFSQPVRLAHAASEADRQRVIAALAQAHRTLYGHGRSLAEDPLGRFEQAFQRTYRCELRAEGPDRAAAIVAASSGYFARAAAAMEGVAPLTARWGPRRAQGKALSVLRLAKAAFTFAGGAHYIAQKIERHSGERLELKPWQRRHPILAGLVLLPRLLKRGAVK